MKRHIRMQRVRAILIKEIAQISRDRRILVLLIIAPLIQLLVIGFAATTDIREIRIAIRDRDQSWHSREYVRAIGASGYFRTFDATGAESKDMDLLVSDDANLIVEIPQDFGVRLKKGLPAAVQVLVDGSDSNMGVQGMNYLQKATRLFSSRIRTSGDQSMHGARAQMTVETRVWYNPGLVSRIYMVPGIMALVLMVTTMIATSMGLVKEKEDGTMEQVIVTPLRPFEIILGKLLPFAIIGFVAVTFALLVIRFVFVIPWRGTLGSIYLMSGLFLLTTLGMGLFVSTLAKNQQQAMTISAFFIMMPFVLLSGFAFSIDNMPFSIQCVTVIIPLKYYIIALRSIFLKGAGMADLWPHAVALLGFGVGILGLAVVSFRKRLD